MSLHNQLAQIQQKLNAPKGQMNTFGGYKYRSCEDILMAVKPLLGELTILISDEMVMLGDRFYVKATASITNGQDAISATAYAREELTKKGMDASQITGSASSYARKYALNGLLLIDDNKDADATNDHGKGAQAKPTITNDRLAKAIATIKAGDYTTDKLRASFALTPAQEKTLQDELTKEAA